MKPATLSWSDEQLSVVTEALIQAKNWRFLTAHDRFEHAWRGADGIPRIALHGLAQLTASHHQLTLGRGRAAVRTWRKARAKLMAAGLDVEVLSREMEALHRALAIDEEGPRFIDANALKAFQSLPMLDAAMLQTPSA